MKLHEKLSGMPAVLGALLGLLLLAGAAAVHRMALPYPQTLFLYLFPVLLAGWTAGRWPGLLLSLAGAAAFAAVGLRIRGGEIFSWPTALEAAAALIVLAVTALLAAALRTARDRERSYSRTDPLTGVFNLGYFMERAEAEIKRARRNRQPLSLACLDIDNLKEVNDLLGFMHGDRLLKAFAGDLRHHTRSSDIIARLGGDEFVILLPEAGLEQAQGAASKIQRAFREAAERVNCQATLSLGLVTVLNPELELEAAMKQASDLLLQAKGDGGNAVREGTLG